MTNHLCTPISGCPYVIHTTSQSWVHQAICHVDRLSWQAATKLKFNQLMTSKEAEEPKELWLLAQNSSEHLHIANLDDLLRQCALRTPKSLSFVCNASQGSQMVCCKVGLLRCMEGKGEFTRRRSHVRRWRLQFVEGQGMGTQECECVEESGRPEQGRRGVLAWGLWQLGKDGENKFMMEVCLWEAKQHLCTRPVRGSSSSLAGTDDKTSHFIQGPRMSASPSRQLADGYMPPPLHIPRSNAGGSPGPSHFRLSMRGLLVFSGELAATSTTPSTTPQLSCLVHDLSLSISLSQGLRKDLHFWHENDSMVSSKA